MNNRTRLELLEKVAEAARRIDGLFLNTPDWKRAFATLCDASRALAAHTPELKEDVKTVRLAVWTGPNGDVSFSIPGSRDDSVPTRWTRLGVVTLPLLPE